MLDSAALIMKNKPRLCNVVEEHITKRLRDGESEVRLKCLSRLIEISNDDPKKLSKSTFQEMIERVKDKKIDIRTCAVVGLARLYSKYISSRVPALSIGTSISTFLRSAADQELWDRLRGIPGAVVNCWGYPEVSFKHLILQLLQEQIIHMSSLAQAEQSSLEQEYENPDSLRATSFLLMYHQLSETERQSLYAIFQTKMKIGQYVASYTKDRTEASRSKSEESHARLRRSLYRLCSVIPPIADKKNAILEKLETVKDKTIFRLLETAVSSSLSSQEYCRNRNEIRQRVDSRSALAEYLGLVYDAASFSIVNSTVIKALLIHMTYTVGSDAKTLLLLLNQIAKYFPTAFCECAGEFKVSIFCLRTPRSLVLLPSEILLQLHAFFLICICFMLLLYEIIRYCLKMSSHHLRVVLGL